MRGKKLANGGPCDKLDSRLPFFFCMPLLLHLLYFYVSRYMSVAVTLGPVMPRDVSLSTGCRSVGCRNSIRDDVQLFFAIAE